MNSRIYFVAVTMITLCAFSVTAQNMQNLTWTSHGIGGGGAFYRPSINPNNPNEYYIQTDMGVVFHTMNYGQSYDQINQWDMGADLAHSGVLFTNDNNIRYKIGDDNNTYPGLPYVFKSVDAGVSWHKIPGFPLDHNIYGPIYIQPDFLFVDYNNPNRLIVNAAGKDALSIDGGNTFKTIFSDSADANYYGRDYLGGCFFDGNNIYIAGRFGMMTSTDGGTTWAQTPLTGMTASEMILSFVGAKQGSTTRFFAIGLDTALAKNNGFCWTNNFGCLNNDNYGTLDNAITSFGHIYSMDVGSTNWVQKMNGINPVNYSAGSFNCVTSDCDIYSRIGMAENDINTVYVCALSKYDGSYDILKSSDGGTSFSRVTHTAGNQNFTTSWLGEGNDYGWGYSGITDMGVCVNNSNRVIFTDLFAIHVSSDGGASWTEAYNDPADAHAAGVTGQANQFYKGSGIENTGLWWLQWDSPTDIVAGYTDISAIRSTDGGNKWTFDMSGGIRNMNTTYQVVKHNTQDILFASTAIRHNLYNSFPTDAWVDQSSTKQSEIMYSSDKGKSWNNMHYFPATVYGLATDPNNDNRLYASVANHVDGIGGVYVTNDLQNLSGSTWTKLPDPPRTEGHPACLKVLDDGKLLCTYSGRAADTATIWNMTNSSGVFIYDPSGGTWSDVSHPNMLWASDIVVDPTDVTQSTWYLCNMGAPWWNYTNNKYNSWHTGGVYRTTNRGASWIELTDSNTVADKPDSIRSVYSMTLNPMNPKQAFIATGSDGLWATDDITITKPHFYKINNFPYISLARIFFNPNKLTEMWVCTGGNGMWMADLSLTGIKKQETAGNYLDVYPVPATSEVNLFIHANGTSFPVIFTDEIGRVVKSFTAEAGQNTVDVSDLSKGIYFVKAGNSAVKKLIVQ